MLEIKNQKSEEEMLEIRNQKSEEEMLEIRIQKSEENVRIDFRRGTIWPYK